MPPAVSNERSIGGAWLHVWPSSAREARNTSQLARLFACVLPLRFQMAHLDASHKSIHDPSTLCCAADSLCWLPAEGSSCIRLTTTDTFFYSSHSSRILDRANPPPSVQYRSTTVLSVLWLRTGSNHPRKSPVLIAGNIQSNRLFEVFPATRHIRGTIYCKAPAPFWEAAEFTLLSANTADASFHMYVA